MRDLTHSRRWLVGRVRCVSGNATKCFRAARNAQSELAQPLPSSRGIGTRSRTRSEIGETRHVTIREGSSQQPLLLRKATVYGMAP